MHLIPTHPTRAFVAAAAAGVIVAAIFREPIAMLWLGSILVGMTWVRSTTGFKIARARRDGLEMYFKSSLRSYRVRRGESFSLDVVVRNRSSMVLQLREFQVLTSPELALSAGTQGEYLDECSNAELTLSGAAARVGHYAVHGLSLRAVCGSGAFEAPLIFTNPIQIVVFSATLGMARRPSLGGLSQRPSSAERTGHLSGDSIELRELRAHQPGDALRKSPGRPPHAGEHCWSAMKS